MVATMQLVARRVEPFWGNALGMSLRAREFGVLVGGKQTKIPSTGQDSLASKLACGQVRRNLRRLIINEKDAHTPTT